LYGLKQINRPWFNQLSSFLISTSFIQSKSDHSFFIKNTPTAFIILLVYVNDIILVGNSLTTIEEIKQTFNNTFKIKNLGELKYFLGFEITRSKTGIPFPKEYMD